MDLNYDFIKSDEEGEFNGIYTMIIGCIDQHGRGNGDIEWMDPRRKKLKLSVNSKLKIAINKFAMDQKWTGAFQLVCYTTYQTQFDNDTSKPIFLANEFVHRGK